MRYTKEEQPSSATQVIDLISAVKELHGLSSQELNKLLRDSENFIIHHVTEEGSDVKIEMEKLVGFLPLHLIAVLMSSGREEALFRYLLSGLRLLHSLCELAPRHAKLEQILLDDVKLSEQLIDMVFYLLIVSGRVEQRNHDFGTLPLMHSALVACCLHLLTGFISSQWQDLAHVLLAHPKVDIFMDAAFGAVCAAIQFLESKLSSQNTLSCTTTSLTAEQVVNYLCLQCEASLQFLQSLCQQKLFRERLLRNKELCGKGGVLFVAQAILKLNVTHFIEFPRVVAAVSRLKARMLSILVTLCEAESISYLDEVASTPGGLDLAKSVASEVLELLKAALGRDPRHLSTCSGRNYPMGFLQLNAMRLADVFSDDSNFRSYITIYFTKVLTAIFSLPHGDFLSSWCSSELPLKEEDGSIEYDSFASAGWVLDVLSSTDLQNPTNLELTVVSNSMSQASYAHQRTALFVKVIANLHCFVPNICEEQERNLFHNKFMECLQIDPSNALPGFSFTSDVPKAASVCRNLRSLLSHAESLIPNFLNDEDVHLLRVFHTQLQSSLISPENEENQVQERKCEESMSWDKFAKLNLSEHNQSAGGCSSPLLKKEPPNLNRSGNLKEEMSENSAYQDGEHKYSEHIQEGDTVREDKGKSSMSAFGGIAEIDKDAQNVETSGSDTSSTRGKNVADKMDNSQLPKVGVSIKESGHGRNVEEKKIGTVQHEEKQRRKRKRTIMNDKQVEMIENALEDAPDMHRMPSLIQLWCDRLSFHGSEVTCSQLKNWLNNRKARLARTGKDVRASSEVDNSFPEKQGGPGPRSSASPGTPAEDQQVVTWRSSTGEISEASPMLAAVGHTESVQWEQGQHVILVGAAGEEIAKGKVFQVHGKWYGKNLDELRTCVVDILELKVKRGTRLPHPSVSTGVSFEEAETRIGVMRVMWDSTRIFGSRSK
ncbi:nodulin homeobox isoform X2 [Humulus lupulus]|uniref:nodulin homeobox isoform X2 n=1 Tax=Humulus lupulus TaxID=3486 RepID=UPI002B415E23|nr:nodulin homeobox isoform X2 [Humulus lupulus]